MTIQWTFPEFEAGRHNKQWYLIAGFVVALFIIYALFIGNFLFAVIIALFAYIVYVTDQREPKTISCEISEHGITVGETVYDFKEISKFWIISQPPKVNNLYFLFKKQFLPRLTIPLNGQDPASVRSFLSKFFKEDVERENEPISDTISRFLKI